MRTDALRCVKAKDFPMQILQWFKFATQIAHDDFHTLLYYRQKKFQKFAPEEILYCLFSL